MEIEEFLAGCARVGATHPARAAEIAEAVSKVFARAERRARARLSVIAGGLSLTAALNADDKKKPLPHLSAADLGLDGLDEEMTDAVDPVVRNAALGLLGLFGLAPLLSPRQEQHLADQHQQTSMMGDAARLAIGDRLATARAEGLTVGDALSIVDGLGEMAKGAAADLGHGAAAALDGGMTENIVKDENLAAFKGWLTQEDDRVRDDHTEAEGQIVDAGEAFDIGGEELFFPRDPSGSPAQTYNCRCYLGWAASLEDAENGDWVALTEGDEGAVVDQSAPDAPSDPQSEEAAADTAALAEEVSQAAREIEPALTEMLSGLAQQNGAEMEGLAARLKTESSVATKIIDDAAAKGLSLDQAAAQVPDALRYTMISEEADLIRTAESVLDRLKAEGYDARIKNSWASKEGGRGSGPYRGINVALTSPNGEQIEVQFHTFASFYAKEVETHGLYKQAGTLATGSPEKAALIRQMTAIADALPVPPGAVGWGYSGYGIYRG